METWQLPTTLQGVIRAILGDSKLSLLQRPLDDGVWCPNVVSGNISCMVTSPFPLLGTSQTCLGHQPCAQHLPLLCAPPRGPLSVYEGRSGWGPHTVAESPYTASKFHTPLGEETEKGDKGSRLLAPQGFLCSVKFFLEGGRSTS